MACRSILLRPFAAFMCITTAVAFRHQPGSARGDSVSGPATFTSRLAYGEREAMARSHRHLITAFGPLIRLAVTATTIFLVETSVGLAQQGEDLREAAQNSIADL